MQFSPSGLSALCQNNSNLFIRRERRKEIRINSPSPIHWSMNKRTGITQCHVSSMEWHIRCSHTCKTRLLREKISQQKAKVKEIQTVFDIKHRKLKISQKQLPSVTLERRAHLILSQPLTSIWSRAQNRQDSCISPHTTAMGAQGMEGTHVVSSLDTRNSLRVHQLLQLTDQIRDSFWRGPAHLIENAILLFGPPGVQTPQVI